MRLHLVSLALLLLALSRPSSSTIYSDTSTETRTTFPHDKQIEEGRALFKTTGFDADKYKALDKVIGNSLYYLILKKLTMIDTLPQFYKKALVNGVLCELAEPSTITEINKVLYPLAATPGAPTDDDRKAADSINCADQAISAKPENTCFCGTPQKPQILCDIEALNIQGTNGTCLKDALAALKEVAPTYGGDDPTNAHPNAATTTDVPTTGGDAKLLCDAAEKAEEAIKKVYAADATLWTLDAIISTGVDVALSKQYGMNDGKDVEASCKEEPLKSSPVGKCVCPLDKGFLLFCYPHLMGKKLQEIGYLDCAANPPSFKDDKKPTTLPDIMVPVKANDITTTEPSSAATSSLLLAAAVVLLGQ